MIDEEAHEFYKNPEHRRVAGPGRRRKADMLTEVKSVRFSARMLAGAEAAAEADGRELGSWVRRLVSGELIRLARMERERIAREHWPYEVIEGSGRAVAPRHIPSSLRGGTRSESTSGVHTFRCNHMTIGGVMSASCGTCGPLAVVS